MSALYSTAMLRAAVQCAQYPLLGAPALRLDGRTPVCGSRLTLDLLFDDGPDRVVQAVGLSVHACAVGQAAAALFAAGATGRTHTELAAAHAMVEAWLTNCAAPAPDWPGISLFEPVRAYPARYAALTLPFRVAASAIQAQAA